MRRQRRSRESCAGIKMLKQPSIPVFAYWVVCLPLGCFLDFVMEHGPAAYWQSLDIGLFFSAVFLTLRMFWLQKKLAREQI